MRSRLSYLPQYREGWGQTLNVANSEACANARGGLTLTLPLISKT